MKFRIIYAMYEDGVDLGGDCHAVAFESQVVESIDWKNAVALFAENWIAERGITLPKFYAATDIHRHDVPKYVLPMDMLKGESREASGKIVTHFWHSPRRALREFNADEFIPLGYRRVDADDLPMEIMAKSDSIFIENEWNDTNMFYPQSLLTLGWAARAVEDCERIRCRFMGDWKDDLTNYGDILAVMCEDRNFRRSTSRTYTCVSVSEGANSYTVDEPPVDLVALKHEMLNEKMVVSTEATRRHLEQVRSGFRWN